MRKLIDAEALKAWIETTPKSMFLRDAIDHIDSLPDLGCARGQGESGTQWCAEVVEMQKELAHYKEMLSANTATGREFELRCRAEEANISQSKAKIAGILEIIALQAEHDAAVELCLLMSKISELEYSAGWMRGNEYFIWSAMQGNRGGYRLTEQEIAELRKLSDAAGGWWIWRGKVPELIPMAEWLEMYAKWEAGR